MTGADAMTVELSAGSLSATVATAKVWTVESSLELVTLVGRTGMKQLAETRVNQVYENQSLGQIVADLAGQAGASTGDVDQGSRYPYLAVHESRSVLRDVLDLARREGMDVYFDADDRLCVKAFTKPAPTTCFRYGVEILELDASGTPTRWRHAARARREPVQLVGLGHLALARHGPRAVPRRARAPARACGRSRTARCAPRRRPTPPPSARLAAIGERAAVARLVVLGRPTRRARRRRRAAGRAGRRADRASRRSARCATSSTATQGYVTVLEVAPAAGGRRCRAAAAGAVGGLLMTDLVTLIQASWSRRPRRLPHRRAGRRHRSHSHESGSDKNNYECDVQLRDSGLELKRVAVATQRVGAVAIPNVDDLVLVQFLNGDMNSAVITGRLYNDKDRSPEAKPHECVYVARTPRVRRAAAVSRAAQRQHAAAGRRQAEAGDGRTTVTVNHDGYVELKTNDKDVTMLTDSGGTNPLKIESGPAQVTVKGQMKVVVDAPRSSWWAPRTRSSTATQLLQYLNQLVRCTEPHAPGAALGMPVSPRRRCRRFRRRRPPCCR